MQSMPATTIATSAGEVNDYYMTLPGIRHKGVSPPPAERLARALPAKKYVEHVFSTVYVVLPYN